MDFTRDLAKCLKEEKDAVLKYQEMAAYAPNEVTRRFMLRISRDEERHADFLAWILDGYTGKVPLTPEPERINYKRMRPQPRVKSKKNYK